MPQNNCNCDNCGKAFYCRPSYLRERKYHYCCKECMKEHRRKPIKKICICCGEEFEQSINGKSLVCGKDHCQSWYRKWFNEPNTVCPVCGSEFYVKPSGKLDNGNCCCYECSYSLRSQRYSGEGNHQYGLRGRDNPSYKGEKIVSHGYIRIYVGNDHPFADERGRILEHRLVAERYLMEDKHKVYINGEAYLSPEYHVHHINEIKTDNRPENLQIVTKSEHTTIHNLRKGSHNNI